MLKRLWNILTIPLNVKSFAKTSSLIKSSIVLFISWLVKKVTAQRKLLAKW